MRSLFTDLDQEWSLIMQDRAATAELGAVCALAGVGHLRDLVERVRRASDEEADRVLAELARRSSSGSELAARTSLQLLLPGTCRLAARWWALGDADERAAAAVAAVYGRIRRYPIQRRPRRIAANVLLDAGQDLWRASRKITRDVEWSVLVDPQSFPVRSAEPEPCAGEELVHVVLDAVEAGIVRPDDAELILVTRVGEHSLPALAEQRGTKLRTLQWRRQRGERALAEAGAAA